MEEQTALPIERKKINRSQRQRRTIARLGAENAALSEENGVLQQLTERLLNLLEQATKPEIKASYRLQLRQTAERVRDSLVDRGSSIQSH